MRRDSRIPICVPVAAKRALPKPGHARAKKLEQLHHLQPRLDFGAGEIVGIERIDVDDARHVDRHFVGIGRDEKRDDLARNVDDAVGARLAPQRVKPGDGGQRCGVAALDRQRAANLVGMGAHVLGEFVEVDVA